jgi:uncharacterized protein
MLRDVDPAALTRLLDVQAEDSAIARLEGRRTTLPEARRLAEVSSALGELNADIEIATKQRDELAREQSRLEGEMTLADNKIDREQGRLFAGNVSNPKELSALQQEVEMLKRQRGQLEDALLEVMVQKDAADGTLSSLQDERTSLEGESERLNGEVAALHGEIDAELAAHRESRVEVAATIPDALLKLYEQTKASKNGVGAAALEGGTCQGCHTRLPAREVERMKREGGLQRCDNCRRILVVA